MNNKKVEGYFEYFNEDGSLDYSEKWVNSYLKEKKHYKNNKLNGISESYYPIMGHGSKNLFYHMETYKDDVLHGAYEVRQSNGLLWERCQFVKGKVDGVSEAFHDTGELWIKDTYKKGELLLREEYYANSQIKFEKSKDGITISYYDNGIISSKGKYAYVIYGPKKQIRSKKDGCWKYYFVNGKIRSKGNYQILNNEYADDIWGHRIEAKSIKKGLWKSFHDNNSLESQGHYVDDKKHGKWIYHGKDGFLIKTETWTHGKKNSQ